MQEITFILSLILFFAMACAAMRSCVRLGPPVRRRVVRTALFACLVVLCALFLPRYLDHNVSAGRMGSPASPIEADHVAVLRGLYNELQTFRHDPEFHRVGFDACCRFSDWKQRLDRLGDGNGSRIYQSLGFVPRDLMTLANHYRTGYGDNAAPVHSLATFIDAGLSSSPVLEFGQGMVRQQEYACVNPDLLRRYHAALGMHQYAEAGRIIAGPGCRILHSRTVVSGPLDSRHVLVSDPGMRKTGALYHQVRTDSGAILWLSHDRVVFR
ncbi:MULTISPECIES: hypothetical protein [unclassified Haematospirillum]|uniref:hypothetical protein n=1 Tax=unclassified Haematospirillum TaxID=2622088 RepID=UPI00143C8D04|nr:MULTISPECIES: hypothetical protein [unclassified Haematospirillum]NKD54819.1 hypothetical protein [Haematospirillum sp. H4890]NKD74657.1 hypothetical protein [Haematospirillum sp. H4485]NKD87457.1 hypothetical protein [Haematospirillum sp. 15-248]